MNKRILIYCRESRDEDGSLFGRIEIQRDMLLQFIKKQGIEGEIEIVLDNNVSGVDFSRLENIARKAENGFLDLLVFKDASRLGRNLRESLNFLHRMESAGVEILFESESYDPELFPLLAWFNERRAAEDSRKVKHVFKHRMESGALIFKAPFGYRKEGNTLITDIINAEIVRKIFALRLSGSTTGEIADELNQDNYPKIAHSNKWNSQQIRRILANRCYSGDMVYRKTSKISFKSKKIRYNPQRDWLVIKKHHEAIIDKKDFEQAQLILLQNRRTATKKLCFSGILRCGGCGAHMIQRRRGNRADGYICSNYHKYGKSACKSHFIREELLIRLFQSVLTPYINTNTMEDMLSNLMCNEHETAKTTQLVKQYEQMLAKIYDDKLKSSNLLPVDIFEKKLAEYTEKLNAAKIIQHSLTQTKISTHTILQALIKNTVYFREVVHRVFESITIYLPGENANSHENILLEANLHK